MTKKRDTRPELKEPEQLSLLKEWDTLLGYKLRTALNMRTDTGAG